MPLLVEASNILRVHFYIFHLLSLHRVETNTHTQKRAEFNALFARGRSVVDLIEFVLAVA